MDLLFFAGDGRLECEFAELFASLFSKDDASMRNKRTAFKRETKSRKAVHFTYVTSFGLGKNRYAGEVQSEVTLDDLFRE